MSNTMRPRDLRVPSGDFILSNLTKVRPLFTLSYRGPDNSQLLIVFSANNIDQSIVTYMRMKVARFRHLQKYYTAFKVCHPIG